MGWIALDRAHYIQKVRDAVAAGAVAGAAVSIVHGRHAEAVVCVTLMLGARQLTIRRRSVEPLLTLPTPGTMFRCGVELTRGESVTGVDRGVVTFFEGWLLFEGLHTSFCLSRVDVARRAQNHLELAEGGGVAFVPDDLERYFSRTLDAWYRLEPRARVESVLPPVGSHASGRARTTSTLVAASLVALLCALFGVGVVALAGREAWGFVVSAFAGLCSLPFARLSLTSARFLRAERRALANETRRAFGR